MRKYQWWFLLIWTVFTVSFPQMTAHAQAFSNWTYWQYHSAHRVSGSWGSLSGNSATQWDTSYDEYYWAIDANSYGPASMYDIEALSTGYDRCSASDPWNTEMWGDTVRNHTSYTNAGRAVGYYMDCGINGDHVYLVYDWHEVDVDANRTRGHGTLGSVMY